MKNWSPSKQSYIITPSGELEAVVLGNSIPSVDFYNRCHPDAETIYDRIDVAFLEAARLIARDGRKNLDDLTA